MKQTVGIQNDKSHYAIAGPAARRLYKKITIRAMRRLGKRLLDQAPTQRRYTGSQS
jgi:hypothetical protein